MDLKRALKKYSTPPKGVHELWERVVEEWNEKLSETFKNFIESMLIMIQAVIKAKDGHTKYLLGTRWVGQKTVLMSDYLVWFIVSSGFIQI